MTSGSEELVPAPWLPAGASADPASNAWTVNGARYFSAPAIAPETYAWHVLGEHISDAAVPPRISGYLKKPVLTLANVDSDALQGLEPIGGVWSGIDGAKRVLDAARAYLKPTDAWASTLKPWPGSFASETEFFEKIGRHDGKLTGSYAQPDGHLSGVGPRARTQSPLSRAAWRRAIRAAVAHCMGWFRKAIPCVGGARPSAYDPYQMRLAKRRFDASKHKGWPSYDSGLNRRTVAAISRFAVAIREGGMSWAHFERLCDEQGMKGYLRPSCTVFDRLQGGRKRIQSYLYDARVDGLVEGPSIQGVFPRFRGIYAVPAVPNLVMREGTGFLTAAIRLAPYTQVTWQFIQGYIDQFLAVNGDAAWSRLRAADASEFDLNVDSAPLNAALDVLVDYDPKGRTAYDLMRSLPVLTPSHSPTAGAYMYWRDRTVLSGMTPTALVDSLVNLASQSMVQLLHAHGRAATDVQFLEDATDAMFEEVWKRFASARELLMLSGDDTLVSLPDGMTDEYYIEFYARVVGMEMKLSHDITFLSAAYGIRSKPIKILTRMSGNYAFRERRFVPRNDHVVAVGVIVRRHLLMNHPMRAAYDRFADATLHGMQRLGLTGTMADVPALISEARREALDGGGADRRSLEDLAYRIAGGGDPNSVVVGEELMTAGERAATLAALDLTESVMRDYEEEARASARYFNNHSQAARYLVELGQVRL